MMLGAVTSSVLVLSSVFVLCVVDISARTDVASDCVEHCRQGNEKKPVKWFSNRMKLSIHVSDDWPEWEAGAVVTSTTTGHSCRLRMTVRESVGDNSSETTLNINCTNWQDAPPKYGRGDATEIVMRGSPVVDLFVVHEDLVIIPSSWSDATSLVVKNSGLKGELETEIEYSLFRICFTFDCFSGCTLRTGRLYDSDLSKVFYVWRSRKRRSIVFSWSIAGGRRKLQQVAVEEPLLDGTENWITIVVDRKRGTINWRSFGSVQAWQHTPINFDIYPNTTLQNITFNAYVTSSSLVTNCHPYLLPCPAYPFNCNRLKPGLDNHTFVASHSSPSVPLRLTIECVVLMTLLIVIAVLAVVACYYKTKTRHSRVQDDNNVFSKRCQSITASKKSTANNVVEESVDYDDFSSVHIYDEFIDTKYLQNQCSK